MSPTYHSLYFKLDGYNDIRFVAMLGDALAGIVSLTNATTKCPTLFQLYVGESFRRMGIGSRLVTKAEESAKHLGAVSLSAVIEPDGPLEWWQNRGYAPVHFENGKTIVSRRL